MGCFFLNNYKHESERIFQDDVFGLNITSVLSNSILKCDILKKERTKVILHLMEYERRMVDGQWEKHKVQ